MEYRPVAMAVLMVCFVLLAYGLPPPLPVSAPAWRLTVLFLCTVAGLVLRPVPGGALVLLAVTAAPLVGGVKLQEALAGYADTTVWLVMAAFFISRALINTGLARRIALLFVRRFGGTAIGVSYALAASDLTLATVIPSNGARSGGVVLPVVRSIAELYGSTPGPTARRIGAFLMVSVYQSICVTAAMFLTGQASNPLAAQIAAQHGYTVDWSRWFLAGILPGTLSLAVIPYLVRRLYPSEIDATPEAQAFASSELAKLGPFSHSERLLAVVFLLVCAGWGTASWHGLDIGQVALLGSIALLLAGVLRWDDVLNERAAWDIFIWYGGLLQLGKLLNTAGVTQAFAQTVGAWFEGMGWPVLLAAALLIYFYSHYAFASITAHMLAMFPAFLALLLAQGAPVGLVVFSFACFANLSAGLTSYGTTPSPMFFGQGYVEMKDWWRIGAMVSIANVLIWGTAGIAWWKLIGFW